MFDLSKKKKRRKKPKPTAEGGDEEGGEGGGQEEGEGRYNYETLLERIQVSQCVVPLPVVLGIYQRTQLCSSLQACMLDAFIAFDEILVQTAEIKLALGPFSMLLLQRLFCCAKQMFSIINQPGRRVVCTLCNTPTTEQCGPQCHAYTPPAALSYHNHLFPHPSAFGSPPFYRTHPDPEHATFSSASFDPRALRKRS